MGLANEFQHPARSNIRPDPEDIKPDLFAVNSKSRVELKLLEFQRGGDKVDGREGITLEVQPSGKFLVYEGNKPREDFAFNKDEIKNVVVRIPTFISCGVI